MHKVNASHTDRRGVLQEGRDSSREIDSELVGVPPAESSEIHEDDEAAHLSHFVLQEGVVVRGVLHVSRVGEIISRNYYDSSTTTQQNSGQLAEWVFGFCS